MKDAASKSFKYRINAEMHVQEKLAIIYAQRNTYLTFSVLFQSLVCWYIVRILGEKTRVEGNLAVMKKQAENASKAYLELVDADKEGKVRKLEVELDVLKKQAQGQHEAYMALADEFEKKEGKGEDKKSK